MRVCMSMLSRLIQSCLTLCNPMDCSPPGSSVCGILWERILEWVAIPYSRDSPAPQTKPMVPVAPALQADSSPLSHWGSPKAVQPGATVFRLQIQNSLYFIIQKSLNFVKFLFTSYFLNSYYVLKIRYTVRGRHKGNP